MNKAIIKNGVISALLMMVLVLGMLPVAEIRAKETTSADWMSAVDGKLSLGEISIPGTHDSGTEHVGLSYIFQCQDTGIWSQLDNGYRYLDLRLALNKDQTDIIIKHNFAKCKSAPSIFAENMTLSSILDDVNGFLLEHPTETVILCMKAENSKDDIAKIQSLLYEMIEPNEEVWYTEDRIPTLEEVRGRAVLATRFADKVGVGADKRGLSFDWKDQGDKEVVDEPLVESSIYPGASLWVQDRFNYDTKDKINAITEVLDESPAKADQIVLNFASTSGKGYIGHPKKYAKKINQYLLDYDWKKNQSYGIVIVDFATEELAKCIYETN